MTKVFLFGDSIARGKNDYQNGGWVKIVEKAFNRKYKDNVFYDLSISGETTHSLLGHIQSDIELRIQDDDKNNVLIIACGINDILFNYQTSKDILMNVSEIVDYCYHLNYRCIILPILFKDNNYQHLKYTILNSNNKLNNLDDKNFIGILAYEINNTIYFDKDKIHLSTEGHKKYAKILIQELRKRKIL